jgi:hypothetical protein
MIWRRRLPTALVKSKVGFAAFEAGVSWLRILVQYEMTQHGHRRLARLGQGIDVASIGYAVMNNYHCYTTPLRGQTPIHPDL